jgi:hypothetical protein
MECAHGIRFSVCRLCETNRLFAVFEAAKTLGTLEDSGLQCTPTRHIVKQPRRTIAQSVWQWIYFGGWLIGGEINLPKAVVLRRFIAASHFHRHPEVLAASCGKPRRMGHKRKRRSFETPRKRAAPQDDGGVCGKTVEITI